MNSLPGSTLKIEALTTCTCKQARPFFVKQSSKIRKNVKWGNLAVLWGNLTSAHKHSKLLPATCTYIIMSMLLVTNLHKTELSFISKPHLCLLATTKPKSRFVSKQSHGNERLSTITCLQLFILHIIRSSKAHGTQNPSPNNGRGKYLSIKTSTFAGQFDAMHPFYMQFHVQPNCPTLL